MGLGLCMCLLALYVEGGMGDNIQNVHFEEHICY
jgi:hypothetical protein